MKKTRKLLSIVLSVLIAFASMPMVYTATVASDISAYAAAQKGTIDNPTDPVSESGEYSQHETNQLSYSQKSLNFTYYQTMNDEYFHLYQAAQMEKYCGSMTASVSVTLGDYKFADDAMTSEFMKSYYESHAWVAGTGASEAVAFPDGFELDGNYWTGCEDYSWSLGVVFKGASADKTGTFTTGYTQNLVYTTNVNDVINNYETPITTTITILDARELVEKIAEAVAVVANPDGYTKEYVSSVQATLNSVPDDLKDFSAVYSQEVINGFVNDFENISKNSADYTEYNRLYASLKAINNSKGAYTDESFVAFKNEISEIDARLSKSLDKTQQAIVDAATQSLREAFSILIYTDLSTSNTGASISGDGDMNFVVDNTAFKFMQIKDDQVFQYEQMWTISRTGGNTARNFGGMILDESLNCMDSDCMGGSTISPNGTTAYIARLTDDSYELITAVNEKEASVTANELTCWKEYTDATGTTLKDTTIIDTSGSYVGALDSNRDYAYDQDSTYYLQNSPKFTGNPAGTYGEFSMSYILRTGWHYKTGGIGGWLGSDNYKHIHINTTIQVTDARQLVSAVDEANATLANPGNHTKDYITALQAAVGSVPVEMYRGVEYYTQAEVDKLYQDITTIPENVADYSEFVEVFEEMVAVNKDKFTEESYNAFIDEIYAINQNLPKNLPADQQSTVDEAVDALYAAYDKIVSAHLNSDNVYTQDDIGVTLGYSPLDFSLSSTQYNFMITADNQQFAVKTDLSLRKTRTDYNCYFRGVGFYAELTDEEAGAGYVAPDCSSDQGCHGLDTITNNHTRTVVASCTGLEKYSARDDGGNIARHNNWVNTSGPNLITNGTFINDVAVSTTESTAQAELYYTVPTGGNTQEIAVDYVLWLGWWYVQPFFGENLSEKTYRHVHIPVSAKFTDARALNALYGEVEDIINGKTDTDYTFDSLVNVYNAFNNVPADMPNGDTYYTQEEVNAQYAALNSAYEELVEGADYSEYFKAYVKAEEIINSGNTDSRGNALYEEEAYNEFVNTVTGIENGLDKGLTKDEEGKNQAIIDEATSGILGAMDTLNESKYADYSALNDAMTEAEKILNAPEGTYTDKTIEEVRSAYDSAVDLSKTLPESEQAQVDAVTSALNAAVNSADFKADYSEFNDAYSQVQDIVNNPDNYTSATVEAAEKALENADKLDKDLADLAVNRQTIDSITQSLQDVINSAEKKADYTDYNNAKAEADSLVNDDGNGNPIYDEDAFNAYKEAVNNIDSTLSKDLPESEQETVNQATSDLDELKATLEEKKIYSVTFVGLNGEELSSVEYVNGSIFSTISAPQLPEATDTVSYVGWLNGTTFMYAESVLTGDVTLTIASEFNRLVAVEGGTVVVDENGCVTGVDKNTTVDAFKAMLQNDAQTVTVTDSDGNALDGDALVGTGAVVVLTSKYIATVYQTNVAVIYGDLDGDGDVDADDFAISKEAAVADETYYGADERIFFVANDLDGDGCIDALDSWVIGNIMRGRLTVLTIE